MKLIPPASRKIMLTLFVGMISISIMAQGVHQTDMLNIDQPDLKKAVSMQKTGKILTITGVGSIAAGVFIVFSYLSADAGAGFGVLVPFIYGIPASLVGTTLWTVGSGRVKLLDLNEDELNLYYKKAANLRNAGMILTFGGIGLMATALIINSSNSVFPFIVGIASTLVGIPLWASGGSLKARAELTLQKFNYVPENSMGLGLGIRITF